jgi:hypothetical protein
MSLTYITALSKIQGGRDKITRKIESNTYLIKKQNYIALKLHGTEVIMFYPDDSFSLSSGGWETVTTKDRINNYCPLGHIYQERNQWYYVLRNNIYKFESGMKISADGVVTGHGGLKEVKERRRSVGIFISRIQFVNVSSELKKLIEKVYR